MKLRNLSLAFALAAVSLGIAGCGDDVVLVSLVITPDNPAIGAGTTQQFTATGTFSNGTTSTRVAGLQWSSSTTGVASINASTGLAACDGVAFGGTVTITATAPVLPGAIQTVSDTTSLTCVAIL